MEKFGRVYTIDFYIGEYVTAGDKRQIVYSNTISVTYPITAEFAIGRSVSAYQNTAMVNIYGLDETKRTLLAKDANNTTKYIKMVINAGYVEATSTIYIGAINECYSVKNGGETEYKTVIDANDSTVDLFMGETSKTFEAGTDEVTRIKNLVADCSELELGIISPNLQIETTTSERAETYDGKTIDILNNLKQAGMVTDNQRVYFLNADDVINSFGVLQVDCDTGMLGTPRRRNANYSVDLIFEPEARLNQLCVLTSTTNPALNQAYKIVGVAHNGIISSTKGGEMTTTLDLLLGSGVFHFI